MPRSRDAEANSDESIVSWLCSELDKAFSIERIRLLGSCISDDIAAGAAEFSDPDSVKMLRVAYLRAEKRIKNADSSLGGVGVDNDSVHASGDSQLCKP